MPFLAFSYADIHFAKKELTYRFYTTWEALPTNWKVELINRNEFAKAALDKDVKAFVVHLASFTLEMLIHLAREAQISLLRAEEITIPVE